MIFLVWLWMLADIGQNFESGDDEELVGRHKDSVEEGDNSVDTGGEIHFEEYSFQSSDESSDEE